MPFPTGHCMKMKNIAETSKRETTGWQLRPTENISKNYSYGRTASAIKY